MLTRPEPLLYVTCREESASGGEGYVKATVLAVQSASKTEASVSKVK